MSDSHSQHSSPRGSRTGGRRTWRQRLRPFVSRDLRTRLLTGLGTVLAVLTLAWVGVSVAAGLDSAQAHQVRTQLELEEPYALCAGLDQPRCTYDDLEQGRIDREFRRTQTVRLAILDELQSRVDRALAHVDAAEETALGLELDPASGAIVGDLSGLRADLAGSIVDLRPIAFMDADDKFSRLSRPLHERVEPAHLGGSEGGQALHPDDPRAALQRGLALHRETLEAHAATLATLAARDPAGRLVTARTDLPVPDLDADTRSGDPWAWLLGRPLLTHMAPADLAHPQVSWSLATLLETDAGLVTAAVRDPAHPVWMGGLTHEATEVIAPPAVRYRSQVTTAVKARLVGAVLLLVGGLLITIVAPVVTATATAREREAGTLPVLRMTGLSATDLAAAMILGPNVTSLCAGGALLSLGTLFLLPAVGLTALVAVAGVVGLGLATNLVAIGLGDALGTRVNAMVVGGLMALGLVVPGLVGSAAAVGGLSTGLLLGPLPILVAGAESLAGAELPVASALDLDLGWTLLLYGTGSLALMAAICKRSWGRRVEQGWAPLFRPTEGIALAMVSVGATALAVLDLSDRLGAGSYDDVNLVTFISAGFLLPVVGWLLVASLRRPARASAVASHTETRRAFIRFQAFIAATVLGVGAAYALSVRMAGLPTAEAELMWATLAQALLFAETAVATLLWMSRRREGKTRAGLLGATLLALQAVAIGGVYRLEVEHVALHHRAGRPLLVGMDASPYWMLFLVLLWGTALGLVLAALLRERDRTEAVKEAQRWEDEDDEDDGEDKPRRWLH